MTDGCPVVVVVVCRWEVGKLIWEEQERKMEQTLNL